MKQDNLKDILDKAAPAAARTILELRVGKELVSRDLATAMAGALTQLPRGKLRSQKDKLTAKGLSLLLADVPSDHPLKVDLIKKIHDALSRS